MKQFTEEINDPNGHNVYDDCVFCNSDAEVGAGAVGGVSESSEIDPKQARKDAINDMKRAHIMDAALRVIARDGYMNVRLEDVAEEAGFSKASIYHYFPDKEALFIHVLIREERADYEKCLEAVGRNLSFLDTIRAFVTVFFDSKELRKNGIMVAGAPISAMSNIMTSMTKHEDLMNSFIKCKWGAFELMVRTVAKARSEGILTIPSDDIAVATMIMSFINACFMRRMYGNWVKSFGDELRPDNVIAPVGNIEDLNVNWVMNAITVFLEPWIKDCNPSRRWYDVQ